MSELEIGCCGAYCATCKPYLTGVCRGCKIGYPEGRRDIGKAKCKIKICCITRGYISCADCENFSKCRIIQDFYNKRGYKYQKYRQAVEYIIHNGYEKFIAIADHWKNAHGKYD
jgi:hypothetical protein